MLVAIASMAITSVSAYVRFETRTDGFIAAADRQHDRVNGELEDLRRIEITNLAEENDDQAVKLEAHRGEIAKLRLLIDHQQNQIDELRKE